MTKFNSVDAGNAHIEAVTKFIQKLVDANRISIADAPALIEPVSDAMLAAIDQFEKIKQLVSKDDAELVKTKVPHKHPRTAKLRAQLEAKGDVALETVPMPVEVVAERYVAPKRRVGRPRKNEAPIALTEANHAFDRDFLARHPIYEGVTVDNSVGGDTITVLMDGKKLKMIKRHLESAYGITFEDYKRIYSLPDDYPSCAPNYKGERSRHARRQGLGTEKVPKKPSTTKVVANSVVPMPVADKTVAA